MRRFHALLLTLVLTPLCAAPVVADAIRDAVGGSHRAEANRARDVYRHPVETLDFFGLKPGMTVVEMSPGAGWYTEILAAAVRSDGKLYAAQGPLNEVPAYQRRNMGNFLLMMGQNNDLYGSVTVTTFLPPYLVDIAPRGSADMVLTFRNLHNWAAAQQADGVSGSMAFRAMFDALKPGGILGVVDHRWPENRDAAEGFKSGYMKESQAIAMAEAVGFRLLAKSEVNANPKDTRDHPRGVWTLPPTLLLGETDRDKYLAIGESDRFTLKFVKPASD